MQIADVEESCREKAGAEASARRELGRASSSGRQRLVVIGNGMVGRHFCKRAQECGLLEAFEVSIFGEEQGPAYDRINLGRVVAGGSVDELTLEPRSWYDRHGFQAHFGVPVLRIDRAERIVEVAGSGRHPYDYLVMATGSRPVLPTVPGVELDGVATYRTAEDANRLRAGVLAAIERSELIVVVGAGLLGLELAVQLRELGAAVRVIETAPHPLSRQLDARAGQLLKQMLEARNIGFHLGQRVSAIARPDGSAPLCVHLSGGEAVPAGLVVFAVGVRARDDLAREAGLACDLFGGVVVDSLLTTSDARIFAIGECARWAGVTYGVVAPGYAMADVVIERLLGRNARFEGMQPATRLELRDGDVLAVGESAFDGSDVRIVVYHDGRRYRRLTLRDGRAVGLAVVGHWEELALAQQAVARRRPFGFFEERRFKSDRRVWRGGDSSLAAWPEDSVVCSCAGVTRGALLRARREGFCTLESLCERTGAGLSCGSCRPLLSSLDLTGGPALRPLGARAVLLSSGAALVLLLVWVAAPAVPYRDTVQGFAYDALWRSSTLRQVTGFGLVGSLVAGSVLSLRKRLSWVPLGPLAGWRAFHTAAGAAALVIAAAHTGLRLGSNLDAALMVTFLLATTLGAVAGCIAMFGRSLPPGAGQRLQRRANRLHVYLVWPLPLLITFHVLRFYYF